MRGLVALNLRRLFSHRFRLLLTVSTLAVAAALVVSASGLVGSTQESTTRSAEALAGSADLEVAAFSDGGFPMGLASEIAAVPGVAVAAPLLRSSVVIGEVRAMLVGADQQALALFPATDDTTIDDGGSGELALAGPLADELGVAPGAGVVVAGAGGAYQVQVRFVARGAGIADVNGGLMAVAALPVAQTLAGRPDRADAVLIQFAPDATPADVRQRITDVVGGRASVVDPGESQRGAGAALEGVGQALGAMAGLALLVSGFVVFNTMSMSALERRKELAVLRALGAGRRPLVAQFLGEAAVIGLLGAVPGSILGVFGARAVVEQLPAGVESTLGTKLEFFLPAWALPAAIVGSIAAAVAASVMPARRAATVPPAEALRPEGAEGQDIAGVRVSVPVGVAGALALAAGVMLTVTGDGDVATVAAGLVAVGAVAVLFAGLRQVTTLTTSVAARFGAPGRLAADSIHRSPRRLWATMTTVMLGVAVTFAIGEVSANLRTAASDTFVPLRDVDLLVQSTPSDEFPTGVGIPADVQTALAAVPGVTTTRAGRFSFVVVDGERLLVQGADPRTNTALISLAGDDARTTLASSDSVVASTQYAERLGLGVGDRLTLQTAVGPRSVEIAGTAPSFLWPNGVLGIDYQRLAAWFGTTGPTYVELELAAGTDPQDVIAAVNGIQSAVPIYVFDGETLIDAGLENIEQVQALLLSFQWIVVVAAGLAILNTLFISLLERRRELGMLRAIGMSRRSMVRTVLAETAAVVVVGGAFGVGLGLLQHRLLVRLSESSGFPADYRFAIAPAVLAVVAAAVMAFLGAFLPARQVSRTNIVSAIGYE